MNQNNKGILVTGAITVDDCFTVLTHEANKSFSTDSKYDPDTNEYRLGGGAGNFIQALRGLDTAFGSNTPAQLITRIGRPPAGHKKAKQAHELAQELLHENDIYPIDVTQDEYFIPLNTVIEHPDGRVVMRSAKFRHANKMAPAFESTIRAQSESVRFSFIDPKKRRMGQASVLAAKALGVMSITDWGESKWPSDPKEAHACDTILRNADLVIVPDDAVVEGMDGPNAGELFERLRDDYKAPNILMSNGGEPVRFIINGREGYIDLENHVGPKYANAAGDTRNAGVIWALSRGFHMREAFEFGTALASVKIRYPGLEWAEHVVEDLREHPRVSHLVDRLLPQNEQSADLKPRQS